MWDSVISAGGLGGGCGLGVCGLGVEIENKGGLRVDEQVDRVGGEVGLGLGMGEIP